MTEIVYETYTKYTEQYYFECPDCGERWMVEDTEWQPGHKVIACPECLAVYVTKFNRRN